MKLYLTRLDYCDLGVFGRLSVDGFDCVTLERDDTLIPKGTYKITMYDSPSNKCVVPMLDVPGRHYIQIHPANWEYELKGCIAVGSKRQGSMVIDSKKTFKTLMEKLNKAVEWDIKIT